LLYHEQGIKESPTRNASQIPLSACFDENEHGTADIHPRHRTQQMVKVKEPRVAVKQKQPSLFPRNA
jgi:hypothetical protein